MRYTTVADFGFKTPLLLKRIHQSNFRWLRGVPIAQCKKKVFSLSELERK
jgi:hypothetical protein